MGYPAKKIEKKWSYADYYSWDDGKRYELIDGEIYDMSPAPSRRHQEISLNLILILGNYFKNKSCDVYAAPFDVRFPDFAGQRDDEIFTVLQPDIVVICDKSKLDTRGCMGSPDIVIEILSPNTSKRDLTDKFLVYERHLVKEYWIVDPNNEIIQIFLLNEGHYKFPPIVYAKEDKFNVGLFPDLEIELNEVFRI